MPRVHLHVQWALNIGHHAHHITSCTVLQDLSELQFILPHIRLLCTHLEHCCYLRYGPLVCIADNGCANWYNVYHVTKTATPLAEYTLRYTVSSVIVISNE